MRWLTLTLIKEKCRETESYQDNILTLYGETAESLILRLCNRTYDEILEYNNNVFPYELITASLMILNHWFDNGTPVLSAKLSQIPYTLDILIKPFMKL